MKTLPLIQFITKIVGRYLGIATQLSILLSPCLSSCKDHIYNIRPAGYIIGENNIETITEQNQNHIPDAILKSAVVFTTSIDQSKRKFCSGTLIRPESPGKNMRILTNHHCFVEDQEKPLPEDVLPGHCSTTIVYFNFYKDSIADRAVGLCQEGSFRSTTKGDIAVFTLQNNPPGSFQPMELSTKDHSNPTKALIVHFPHIETDDPSYKENTFYEVKSRIRIPYGQVTYESCEAHEAFFTNEIHLDPSLRYSFKHTCDQEKGSSGSALWDVNQQKIIGLNWGGIVVKYPDLEEPVTYNIATRSEIVNRFINNETYPQEQNQTENAGQNTNQRGSTHPNLSSASNQNQSRKSLCGVIGPSTDSNLLLLFLLPLAIVLIPIRFQPRRRDPWSPQSNSYPNSSTLRTFTKGWFDVTIRLQTTITKRLTNTCPINSFFVWGVVGIAILAPSNQALASSVPPLESSNLGYFNRWAKVFLFNQIISVEPRAFIIAARNSPALADKIQNGSLTADLALEVELALELSQRLGQDLKIQPSQKLLPSPSRIMPWQSPPDSWATVLSEVERPPNFDHDLFEVMQEVPPTCAQLESNYQALNKLAINDQPTGDLIKYLNQLPEENWLCLSADFMATNSLQTLKTHLPGLILNLANGILATHMSPKNQALPILQVISHLQQNDYPEALRTVHRLHLNSHDEFFRWAYQRIQRQFNFQQNGTGKVAIQSI